MISGPFEIDFLVKISSETTAHIFCVWSGKSFKGVYYQNHFESNVACREGQGTIRKFPHPNMLNEANS